MSLSGLWVFLAINPLSLPTLLELRQAGLTLSLGERGLKNKGRGNQIIKRNLDLYMGKEYYSYHYE